MNANKKSWLKTNCKRCIRSRWLMTFLMLTTMAVVLYLDQFST